MDDQNDPDYKDYQDYLEYQRHISGAQPQGMSTSDLARRMIPPGKYQDMAAQATSPDSVTEAMSGAALGGTAGSAAALGKGAARMVGKAVGSGAANDVLGVVSPRIAKLAALLGKIAPEAESGAAKEAGEAVAPLSNAGPSAPKPRIDPFTKKRIP